MDHDPSLRRMFMAAGEKGVDATQKPENAPGNDQKRKSGEMPRDKPVEEEADKDIKKDG